MKVLLVGSAGGHLAQLAALEGWWSGYERHWVSFDTDDVKALLDGESVTWAYHPTTRNIPNLIRNFFVARRVLKEYRPDVVVSCGAAVAVPFFYLAKVYGIKTVYFEVYDRIDSTTMTGRMCRPVSDLFLVQWEEQQRRYAGSTLVGQLM